MSINMPHDTDMPVRTVRRRLLRRVWPISLTRSNIVVFQSFNLINYKNALENVALPLFYQGIGRRKRNAMAMEQLERMGLADRAHHLPGE